MRLVKAAKASPHAKFYNLSTAQNRIKFCIIEGTLGIGIGLVDQ